MGGCNLWTEKYMGNDSIGSIYVVLADFCVGFKVSLLTTHLSVCIDRIQGGNVWIFKRTLASYRVFNLRLGGGL